MIHTGGDWSRSVYQLRLAGCYVILYFTVTVFYVERKCSLCIILFTTFDFVRVIIIWKESIRNRSQTAIVSCIIVIVSAPCRPIGPEKVRITKSFAKNMGQTL